MKRAACALAMIILAATAGKAQQDIGAQAYLAEALKQLRENHVNRDKVDWPALEARLTEQYADAKSPSDTYPAIRQAIAELNEKHTTLEIPEPPSEPNAPRPAPSERPRPEVRLVEGAIGYVRVVQFGGSREAGAGYAAILRDGVAELDSKGACGWIVDVRGNGGGNVWPMFDGVGALLGGSHVLTFDIPGQGQFRVLFKDGVSYQEDGKPPYAVAGFKALRNPLAPVAILIDKDTGSSAEALVVAFAGRPNVRRFGERTADYITVNNPARLADGAYLNVTVGWNVDRLGRRYEKAIEPDEPTAPGIEALEAAAVWLKAQPQCRKSEG